MPDNIVLPVEQYPEQTFRIDLDSVPTTFRFYWSAWDESMQSIVNEISDGGPAHTGCWYMDITTDEFTVNGIPVTQGCDLLEPYAYSSLGGIFVMNLLKSPSDLSYESMAVNHFVLYVLKENLDTFYSAIGYS